MFNKLLNFKVLIDYHLQCLIFLIDGGVCKVDPVAAVVVTEGVDGFPEAVEGVEALNSRSTSLLTFG